MPKEHIGESGQMAVGEEQIMSLVIVGVYTRAQYVDLIHFLLVIKFYCSDLRV